MEYILAIWLIGQNVPQYVVGENQLGARLHAISMTHADCLRGKDEATRLHSDHVAKAACEKADKQIGSVDKVLHEKVPVPHPKP